MGAQAFEGAFKPCNFGLYEGRVVACDYTSLIVNARTEMRGVNWHDDE